MNFVFVPVSGLTAQKTEAFCLRLGRSATAQVGGLEPVPGEWAQTAFEGERGGGGPREELTFLCPIVSCSVLFWGGGTVWLGGGLFLSTLRCGPVFHEEHMEEGREEWGA